MIPEIQLQTAVKEALDNHRSRSTSNDSSIDSFLLPTIAVVLVFVLNWLVMNNSQTYRKAREDSQKLPSSSVVHQNQNPGLSSGLN